jgi:large subunit ribosomal protein L32
MAVPKRRQSHSRKMMRRANHDRITPPTLATCPSCDEPVRPHHVCGACGKYRGSEIIAPVIELSPDAAEAGDAA